MPIQRFMLLASARTGSNLLLSLLSDHPSIKTYGELFKLDVLPRDSLLEALEDPVRYLGRRVYKTHRPNIATVGFKMFYYHLKQEYFHKPTDAFSALHHMQDRSGKVSAFIDGNYQWSILHKKFEDTWSFLLADLDLKVIHLKRRNLLNTLISLKTAFKTKRWWSLKGQGQPHTTVHLDPEECRACFQKLNTFARDADEGFKAHRKLEVVYEDLVTDRQATLARVFAFLNVPCRAVSTRMTKQISAPAAELVDNYPELKEYFQNTKWAAFFD